MKRNLVLFFLLAIHNRVFTLQGVEQKGPVLLVVGTRPDGIKMAPVYHALKQRGVPTFLCSTDQHIDLLQDVFKLFSMQPDASFMIMKPGQDLFYITAALLERFKELYKQVSPSLVLVQGDTTTAMAAALAAFYLTIPVGHVEAGLRTYNMAGPFPEELNRRIITLITSYHFAPTQLAVEHLLAEGVAQDKIFNTGNTVVDSLLFMKHKIDCREVEPPPALVEAVSAARVRGNKVVILTAHRRESFPYGFRAIFSAIKKAVALYPNLYVIYPIHPNPAIRQLLQESGLENMPNMLVTKPLSYIDMQYLLCAADAIVTDSGGLQEEAVSLNKPVLVLRKETERMEGVEAGVAVLVGDDEVTIVEEIGKILERPRKKFNTSAVYGDGYAGEKIAKIIQEHLSNA
jgi:UDP-N-acetylglucosamine 2-epimerase (non-hydrolysing)